MFFVYNTHMFIPALYEFQHKMRRDRYYRRGAGVTLFHRIFEFYCQANLTAVSVLFV